MAMVTVFVEGELEGIVCFDLSQLLSSYEFYELGSNEIVGGDLLLIAFAFVQKWTLFQSVTILTYHVYRCQCASGWTGKDCESCASAECAATIVIDCGDVASCSDCLVSLKLHIWSQELDS